MRREEIELLAPAGSYEGFEAAIGAGADAVYVGGAAFGARAYAKNFGEEELLRAIDTAHIHGRKLYLTVNTLLKNRELSEQLYDYLLPYYKEGLDAVIVQDMGVFKMIREMFPGMHLHASTQMTVTGPEGMKFLEEQGASRVVTARELSLEEIRRMHETSPIEIESFVHGALCYSYSGQCLMSSILARSSRGISPLIICGRDRYISIPLLTQSSRQTSMASAFRYIPCIPSLLYNASAVDFSSQEI